MVLLPLLLLGPCLSEDTGELRGAPLGLVGNSNLAKRCLLLLVDLGLRLQDVLLEAGKKKWVSKVWSKGVLSGITGIWKTWCLARRSVVDE